MKQTTNKLGEFDLIARMTSGLTLGSEVRVGAGDDCAVVEVGLPDRELLLKTDSVVEGIHFERSAGFERVGRKAMGRALSDVAAMGGRASSALITLGLPTHHTVEEVDALYAGLRSMAAAHGVSIVGGETTRNPERYLISVSVVGWVTKGKAVLRSGARVGDAIFVSGELGGSMAGRHLDFEPRLAEAGWLVEHFDVHAMMDLSDGLAGDLRHILRQSGVGAELLGRAIPTSREARLQGREGDAAKPPLLAALTDGEDFELVFTVSSKDAVRVLDGWKQRFPEVNLSCVGRILAEPGLRIRDERGVRDLEVHGYDHFEKS